MIQTRGFIRYHFRRRVLCHRFDVDPLGRLDDVEDVDGDGEEQDEEEEKFSRFENRFPLTGKVRAPPVN